MQKTETLKAKDKLEIAFFDLLEENHYSKITVSELIEKAGVSRTTFYRNYVDIFDMYDKVCEHLLRDMLQKALAKPQLLAGLNAVDLFEEFCEKLKSQEKYILLLCGKNGGRNFFEKMLSIVYSLKDSLLLSPDIFTKEDLFRLKFVCFAGIGSYIQALIEGRSAGEEILSMCRMILSVATADKEILHE
ncbi:MAG: TetR/AcrR family transcriptional regulator [Clostridia bacterium]|nr:TetR/AcrR family transcriptional regulator [Clostridia bacterium]